MPERRRVSKTSPPTPPNPSLLLTCEHGGNVVPPRYRELFKDAAADLRCHRGWDPGALKLANALAVATRAPLIASTTTRLLIDLNRTAPNPAMYSRYTAPLDIRERTRIFRTHYFPHFWKVTQSIHRAIDRHRTPTPLIHIGVHSFTPVLRGRRRDVHVGLLFDPARPDEARLCRAWRDELLRLRPRWTVAFNRPYKGTDDGLTTKFRRIFTPAEYLGIELEVSQPLLTTTGPTLRRVHQAIGRSLALALSRGDVAKPTARAGR